MKRSNTKILLSSGLIAAFAIALGMSASAFSDGLADATAQAEAKGFPKPKFIQTNGIRMAVYEKGQGFPVVFSHGFPELAFSWRLQMTALADAGFRAIAPDQRGYGLTERPEAVDAYHMGQLTDDLAGLLDALDIEKAVFVGHDWGGAVVYQMALRHPDRVAGVIGVNTPHSPRLPIPPLEMLRNILGENNYIVTFQEPNVADEILGADPNKTFRLFLRADGMTAKEFAKLPADAPERSFDILGALQSAPVYEGDLIISDDELAFYVETYKKTGFTGGINWYRNIDRYWEMTAGLDSHINVPVLYVGAEDDIVLPPSRAAGMGALIPDLEKHIIADCGHWTQQQKPDELNATILKWLNSKFGGTD